MIESDETVQMEWNKLTGTITGLFCDHSQRGFEYVKSRGLHPPRGRWPNAILIEIGAMLRFRDLIANGAMKSLWPKCRHTATFFEFRTDISLLRLQWEPDVNLKALCTMHWPITCFLLQHESWWNTDKNGKADPQSHLLSAVELNSNTLDALASLLWAKSENMN
jgi:hypothetical protein